MGIAGYLRFAFVLRRAMGAVFTETQAGLIQIANRLHRRVVTELFGEDRPHLTPRELDCLAWVALGKDTTEIGQILEISPHTAPDYLKSFILSSISSTSAQAVTKAVKLGLLIL